MKLFGKTTDFTKQDEPKLRENLQVPKTFNIDIDPLWGYANDYDVDMNEYGKVIDQIRAINNGENLTLSFRDYDSEMFVGPELVRKSIIQIKL